MHKAFLGVKPATIEWREIEHSVVSHFAPYSSAFDDIYFNTNNGIAESEYVFIQGNQLPERFLNQPEAFSIFETGFGSGLNFFLTANLWQKSNPKGHLDYFSVEQFPLGIDDLKRIYRELNTNINNVESDNINQDHLSTLIDNYPPILPGIFPIQISENITLHLIYFPLDKALKEIALHPTQKIDAWFLDGFAPSKNPTMWHKGLWHFMSLKAINTESQRTSVATFTAASEIRKMMQHYGFEVSKRKGFGRKREMLTAQFNQKQLSTPKPDLSDDYLGATNKQPKVAIIGAGLAGASCAFELNAAGIEVHVYEQASEPASGASKMPAMLATPNFSTDHNAFSQLTFAGFYSLVNHLKQHTNLVEAWKVLQLSTEKYSPEQLASYCQEYKTRLHDKLSIVDDKEYSQNKALQAPALQVNGPELCKHFLQHIPEEQIHFNTEILSFDELSDFDAIIICSGHKTLLNNLGLQSLPSIDPLRGQLTAIDAKQELDTPINYDGHLFESQDHWYLGATFTNGYNETPISEDDIENIEQANQTLPYLIDESDIKTSYAGVRASTYDRFPFCGLFSEDSKQSVWLNYGFGTRGLNLSLLCAQIIKSSLLKQPLPVEKNLLRRLSPNRLT